MKTPPLPGAAMKLVRIVALSFAPLVASAQLVGNPACPGEDVFYNPGNGEDVIVPDGYKIEVFVKDLNMPTDIAFANGRMSRQKPGGGPAAKSKRQPSAPCRYQCASTLFDGEP